MSTPLGERMKKVNSLTSRDRRRWVNQLMGAQETVEKAEEGMTEVMLKAYDAGMSYAMIGAAIGLHSTTIQQRVQALREDS